MASRMSKCSTTCHLPSSSKGPWISREIGLKLLSIPNNPVILKLPDIYMGIRIRIQKSRSCFRASTLPHECRQDYLPGIPPCQRVRTSAWGVGLFVGELAEAASSYRFVKWSDGVSDLLNYFWLVSFLALDMTDGSRWIKCWHPQG